MSAVEGTYFSAVWPFAKKEAAENISNSKPFGRWQRSIAEEIFVEIFIDSWILKMVGGGFYRPEPNLHENGIETKWFREFGGMILNPQKVTVFASVLVPFTNSERGSVSITALPLGESCAFGWPTLRMFRSKR